MPQARNAFERYLEDISSYPRISPAREAELSHIIQAGRNEEQCDFLCAEMESLPPRTRSMLSLLYLNESTPTLRDLASQYSISSERCRQVCMQGLHQLRSRLQGRLPQIDPGMPAVCAA